MSAAQVTDKFVEAWNSGVYDLVVCNLANGDMVGHTGVLPAAIAACETVDQCVGRMAAGRQKPPGPHADHCGPRATAKICSPRTANRRRPTPPTPCPASCCSPTACAIPLADGRLADVAPTLLALWGLPTSPAMTGRDLTGEHTRG